MSTATFQRAVRQAVPLKIALYGPSGSGKTDGALALARGLVGPNGRIALVDSENRSASLYAQEHEFDTLAIDPPYLTEKYLEAIRLAAGDYDVIILDTISHQWAGSGGILERLDEAKQRPGTNQYTVWGPFTKEHEKFRAAMLEAPIHLIATIRAKQGYVLEENGRGKQAPKKVGMEPVQREGLEYEFSLVFELQMDHRGVTSKDRTKMFSRPGELVDLKDPKTAERLINWLQSGGTLAEVAPSARELAARNAAARREGKAPEPSPASATNGKTNGAAAPAPTVADDIPPCPKCGGRMWDNRIGKRNLKAPDFKCRDRSCDGVIWPPKEGEAADPQTASSPTRATTAVGDGESVDGRISHALEQLAREQFSLEDAKEFPLPWKGSEQYGQALGTMSRKHLDSIVAWCEEGDRMDAPKNAALHTAASMILEDLDSQQGALPLDGAAPAETSSSGSVAMPEPGPVQTAIAPSEDSYNSVFAITKRINELADGAMFEEVVHQKIRQKLIACKSNVTKLQQLETEVRKLVDESLPF